MFMDRHRSKAPLKLQPQFGLSKSLKSVTKYRSFLTLITRLSNSKTQYHGPFVLSPVTVKLNSLLLSPFCSVRKIRIACLYNIRRKSLCSWIWFCDRISPENAKVDSSPAFIPFVFKFQTALWFQRKLYFFS